MNKWMQDCRTWCWEVWVQHVGSRNLLSCAFNCVMFVCGCLMDLQALSFSPLLMVKLQRRKGPQAVGQFLVESRVGNVRPGFSHANLHVIFFLPFNDRTQYLQANAFMQVESESMHELLSSMVCLCWVQRCVRLYLCLYQHDLTS